TFLVRPVNILPVFFGQYCLSHKLLGFMSVNGEEYFLIVLVLPALVGKVMVFSLDRQTDRSILIVPIPGEVIFRLDDLQFARSVAVIDPFVQVEPVLAL